MIKLKHILLESVEHKKALELVASLIKGTEFEGKSFLAGGGVRDELMGKDAKDLDITVALPEGGIKLANFIAKKLSIYRDNTNPIIFPTFGTAKVSLDGVKYQGYDLSGVDMEFVMTRKEKYSDRSRKPEVDYGTPEQDAERRDLTINSLLKDLSSGEIKDFTGKGMQDLKNKIIRTPLDPDVIYAEDPLRMLRTIRFTVKYGWKLPFYMIKSLKKNAHLLQNISAERIQEELNKILLTDNPDKGIKLMHITDLMKYVISEFNGIVRQASNGFHKWSTDRHTYEVLKSSPPKLIVRLAALFHDIGKSNVRTGTSTLDYKFIGHEQESANIVKNAMKKLKYPNDIILAVEIAVLNHMRAKQFGPNAELVSDKILRRLSNDLGNHLDNTLDLMDADNKSHGPESENWPHNLPNQIPALRNRLKQIGNFSGKLQKPINGNDVIRVVNGIEPSFLNNKNNASIIGKILSSVDDAYLENPQLTKDEAEEIIVQSFNKIRSISMTESELRKQIRLIVSEEYRRMQMDEKFNIRNAAASILLAFTLLGSGASGQTTAHNKNNSAITNTISKNNVMSTLNKVFSNIMGNEFKGKRVEDWLQVLGKTMTHNNLDLKDNAYLLTGTAIKSGSAKNISEDFGVLGIRVAFNDGGEIKDCTWQDAMYGKITEILDLKAAQNALDKNDSNVVYFSVFDGEIGPSSFDFTRY